MSYTCMERQSSPRIGIAVTLLCLLAETLVAEVQWPTVQPLEKTFILRKEEPSFLS